MTRRWKTGDQREIAGIRFRVARGVKADGDLRVDWLTPSGWRAVPMASVALLTDFFFENEELLYPRANGAKGGYKFLEYVFEAAIWGVAAAENALQAEKANAAAKRNGQAAVQPLRSIQPHSFVPAELRRRFQNVEEWQAQWGIES